VSKFNVDTAPRTDRPIPMKQWTSLDHLTHDFTNDPGYRRHCLETRGQYMAHDGRRVTA
jgi:hypothetical protein